MLEWLDGRNGSSFKDLSWNADANSLSFTVAAGAGANGLQAMVPARSDAGPLTGLTRDGAQVNTTKKTIKGVEYAFFAASAGNYVASYGTDTTPPAISTLKAEPGADGSATISWTTDEPSDSRVEYGTSASSLDQSASDATRTTSHSLKLTGLQADTTYYYRVSSTDADNNTATSPPSGQAPASFQSPPPGFTDTTVADFSAGSVGTNSYVSQTADGEVILNPTVGAEFSGAGLPAGWTSTPWSAGGTSTVSNGSLSVDGARAGTDALYGPGRSLEFAATFGASGFQHVGLGVDYNGVPWAMFSTGGGSLPVGLYARTNGPAQTDTPITGVDPSTPHLYRIEWKPDSVVYYVDGTQVASHSIAITSQMRPLASDFNVGGPSVSVDWLRMSPYAASGTFESRVFDSGKSASDWLKLDSTPQKPTGTNAGFETRSGNTATPDSTWSAWEAIGADGTIASPSGRYVQYRANLSTTDASATPSVQQVTIGYGAGGPDITAPAISALDAKPAEDGSATISWTTDEPSDSRVEYGTSASSLDQSASDATRTTSHSLKLTGLQADTTYYYRVSSTDADNNTATSPPSGEQPSNFVMPPPGFTDTTVADFSAGSVGTNSYVSQTADGEVILNPTVGAEFSGAGLPAGWTSTPWSAGGTSTVSNGSLSVDG